MMGLMTDPDDRQTPDPRTPGPVRQSWLARHGEEIYARSVLAAPLVVAGWFQSHVAHDRLGLPWGLAIAFTVAWEGAAAYCALLYHRTLVAGDSTVMLRLGMLGYGGVSCGLLWWHLHAQAKPWYLAAAVGALTMSGIYLWSRRARWLRRDDLRRRGMVDAQVVRFALASWLAAPLETPAALRYAIKNRISHPIEALNAYRTDRKRHRTLKALTRSRQAARTRAAALAQTPKPVASPNGRTPVPTKAQTPRVERKTPAKKAPQTAPVRTLHSTDDSAALASIAAWAKRHDQTPSLDDIQERILKCGRSRAVRIARLYRGQTQTPGGDSADDPKEESRGHLVAAGA
jgi:hypothetical protein